MSLMQELRRRNVIRVGMAYVVIAWVIAQAADLALDNFDAPAWVIKTILLTLALGFPLALFFAWAFELTPEGIKKEKDVDRSTSITPKTGRKLDYTIIGVLAIALVYFIWESRISDGGIEQVSEAQQAEIAATDAANSKSIAVLPFSNLANSADNEPFTVGIHDDLLTHLSKVSALTVISRTSVLRYKDTQKSIGEIAEELGVANILEGGVQRAGNQIRINVQLIDAKTDQHLWAEVFDRELSTANIFKIQTEIAEKIAAALKATLTPEEIESIQDVPTNNLDAYNAYIAGRQRMLERTSESLEDALALFERATTLDPNYALAYVGQADSMVLLNTYGNVSFNEMVERMEPLLAKALALAPNLAEAHTAQAGLYEERGEFEAAERSFKRSLALNPNYATTYQWYCGMLGGLARYEEALSLCRQGALLDPLSPVIQSAYGWALQNLGRSDEALAQFYRVIDLDPNFPGGINNISIIKAAQGKLDEAIIWLRKAVALDPANFQRRGQLAQLYMDIGLIDAASREVERMKVDAGDHGRISFYQILLAYEHADMQGALELSQQWLAREPENPDANGVGSVIHLLSGRYAEAIRLGRHSFPGPAPHGFILNKNTRWACMKMAYALRQTGETALAQMLIDEIFALTQNPRDDTLSGNAFILPELHALNGDPEAAARTFAAATDLGYVTDWQLFEVLPYMDETRRQPVYQNALADMKASFASQRARLAEHDRLEQAQEQ